MGQYWVQRAKGFSLSTTIGISWFIFENGYKAYWLRGQNRIQLHATSSSRSVNPAADTERHGGGSKPDGIWKKEGSAIFFLTKKVKKDRGGLGGINLVFWEKTAGTLAVQQVKWGGSQIEPEGGDEKQSLDSGSQ
jgi:hypothetical protein